jgi:hypothetical protein
MDVRRAGPLELRFGNPTSGHWRGTAGRAKVTSCPADWAVSRGARRKTCTYIVRNPVRFLRARRLAPCAQSAWAFRAAKVSAAPRCIALARASTGVVPIAVGKLSAMDAVRCKRCLARPIPRSAPRSLTTS